MDRDLRILSHPILEVPERKEISLQFDGKKYLALEGETVASALYANGIKIFSRSEKYHRPRGLFCVEGNCSHCLMRVNGIPNTRVCKTLTEEGMEIESQNAWPSLRHDLASISVLFSRFIRPGFYYKYLKRPRWAYLIYEKMLRKMAGFGEIADHNVVQKSVRKVFAPQILIVGAGLSGMKAALTAAVSGAEVWLVEGESELGGRSAWDTSEIIMAPGDAPESACAVVTKMANAVISNPNIEVLTSAKAISWHVDEEVMVVVQPGIYWEINPGRTILATGSYETPVVFGNSDMPGIFLASGLQRLMHRDFVKPGRSALVVTGSDRGYVIARQLAEAGVDVKAIADSRLPDKERGHVFKIGSHTETSIYYECRVEKATGRKTVNRAILKNVSDERKVSIDCDVIVVDGPQIPANELAFQKSCRGMYLLESEFQLTRKVAATDDVRVDNEMFIIGSANGCNEPAEKVRQGRLAGTMSVMGMP